jgi:hypothetical protein
MRYEVQFFRGNSRIFVTSTTGTRIVLPASWRYEGDREALKTGSYRWYVWALRGKRLQRDRKPLVQTTFVVAPTPG